VRDMIRTSTRCRAGGRSSSANCPGVISPDEIKIGIMPGHIHKKGRSALCRAQARSLTKRSDS